MREAIDVANNSLRRCNTNPGFLELFYETFIASSDEVAQKFAHTDFKRQRKALALSLRMIMMAAQGSDAADTYLQYIAERHSKNELDIKPDLYDLWLDSLCRTVQHVDPEYTAEVEAAWRKVVEPGIEFMKEHY